MITCVGQDEGCEGQTSEGRAERLWYQKVEGWEKRRDAGGTNAIALRVQTNVWLCPSCLYRRRRGVAGQASLL